MRNAFAKEVTRIAKKSSKLVLLSGDIGNRLFDEYKNIPKGNFLNCGIAEANMMGVAAGLAMSGLKPIIYTITPFTTTRCFEQIRVDACYHNVPVIIVGTGSGLSYASLGPTHHSLEDFAIFRPLPNITILAPADEVELRKCLNAALKLDSPVYIRIGKKGEEIESLKASVQKIVTLPVQVNIKEVRKPDLDATILAEGIAQQLERRVQFRRAMKRAVQSAMRQGAKGIRTEVSGRLGGAEIARAEWYREGQVPLHTLRANIDYGVAEAATTYGLIGVKVHVYTGEVLGDPFKDEDQGS